MVLTCGRAPSVYDQISILEWLGCAEQWWSHLYLASYFLLPPPRLSSDFWRRFSFQVGFRCCGQCLQRTGALPCRCPWEGFTCTSLALLPPKPRGNFSWIFTMNPGGPPESLKCKCPFKAADSRSH